MKTVTLYTDGACTGNPGHGGWAAILSYRKTDKEISGGELQTTNNRMELTAVIKGLEMLKEPCTVKLYSDSAYVVNAFTQKWIKLWQERGWKNFEKHQVANIDLWTRLYELSEIHKIKWNKVLGHSGDELNERCDKLAKAEAKKFKKELN